MIAVIFEVCIKPGADKTYLDFATNLRPLLQDVDGFISVERFQSMVNPNKLLSLSLWRDEDAVKQWRTQLDHRQAQLIGRNELFDCYTIRVVNVLREYTLTDRQQVPID